MSQIPEVFLNNHYLLVQHHVGTRLWDWITDACVESQFKNSTGSSSNIEDLELLSFCHRIPENNPSHLPLQPSASLPESMGMFAAGTATIPANAGSDSLDCFNEHWITQLVEYKSDLKRKKLRTFIAGSFPTPDDAGFENGHYENRIGNFVEMVNTTKCFRLDLDADPTSPEGCIDIPARFVRIVSPDRMIQHVIVVNPENFTLFGQEFQVYTMNGDETTVHPWKGKLRYEINKRKNIPTCDLGVFLGK
ncbi:hypothetical protein BDQ17DRAFT_1437820 [Cyathus striatus]|nr:hypothetical protein BDQ17DRAFT_1437820 [Cyathus striatus]